MHEAFLIGIRTYPDHGLPSVANDLPLLAAGLRHQGYAHAALHVFDDTHTTRAALVDLLRHIRARYTGVTDGSCLVHFGASGALSLDPLEGGVLLSDSDPTDFRTALPFAALNEYLPLRPGVRVTTIVDT